MGGSGALERLDSPTARRHADTFFAQNVPRLIDSYRVDRWRRLRACLFLLRAELKDADVEALTFSSVDDDDVRVSSWGRSGC